MLKQGPIIKTITCQYIKPVTYPTTLTLFSTCMDVREKGLTMGALFMRQKEIVAMASAVIISYDFLNGKPTKIPDEIRHHIELVEQHVPQMVKTELAKMKA